MDIEEKIDFSPGSLARNFINTEFQDSKWELFRNWYFKNFEIKETGDAFYLLGIEIYCNKSKRILILSQKTYISKILKSQKI